MVFKRVLLLIFFLGCAVSAQARQVRSADEALRLGDEAFLNGQYSKAEEYYRLIWRADPGQAVPIVRLGQLYYAQGHYALARRTFEAALALKKDPPLQKFLQSALQKMKSAGPLLEEIEKASEKKDDASLRRLHAEAARRMSGGSALMVLVAPHVEYLLAENPSDTRLLKFLADGYFMSGDSMRAFLYTKKLARRAPQEALYRRLGDIAVNVGATDEARISYKQALREAVRQGRRQDTAELKKLVHALPAFSAKIDALIESEEYEAAFRQLRKCLVRNPSNSWALVKMGTIYERIGRLGQAESLYQKAVLWRY